MNADQQPKNPARRRLAQGGLAAPVVLASLASKNAFAAVPYHCTISGKLSNNMSPFGPNQDQGATCKIGFNRSVQLQRLRPLQTTFSSVGFRNIYFADGDNETAKKLAGEGRLADPKFQPATLYQVLKLTDYAGNGTNAPKDPEFAKMAVVLYQNATVGPTNLYPLTKQQVVDMFNAAINSLPYNTNTSAGPISWTPSEVKSYFSELYPG